MAKSQGKRVNIWLSGESLEIWEQLENRSAFVRMALEDAVGIMTWAILKKENPEKYKLKERPIEEVVEEFNGTFPSDPLTATRLGKQTWQESSPKKPELW